MFSPTRRRVRTHTSRHAQQEIEWATQTNVARYGAAGADAIGERLQALDREWDVERSVELNMAIVVLAGTVLGTFVDRRWYALPAVASGFMVQHVLQGWCPPVPVLRRRGVRYRGRNRARTVRAQGPTRRLRRWRT